jgi:AcrR family transcriptional regulator
MARPRSPEKSRAILEAAVREIALTGLGASTARIAKAAGVAEGTLFTYFPTKNDLFNELYVSIKSEVYSRINASFPHDADLRDRARHLWSEYLAWSIEKPEECKVSRQLNLSEIVTDATRERLLAHNGVVNPTVREIAKTGAFREMPPGFVASAMAAMQDAVMDTVARQPRLKKKLIEKGFEAFWKMAE